MKRLFVVEKLVLNVGIKALWQFLFLLGHLEHAEDIVLSVNDVSQAKLTTCKNLIITDTWQGRAILLRAFFSKI